MKSKSALYARALVSSLEKVKSAEEITERITRFRQMLKAHGALRSMGAVARECEKLLRASRGRLALVSRANPPEKREGAALQELLKRQGFRVEEEVREELIGGVALLLDNRVLIDGSVRGKLQKIRSLFHGHHTPF